MNISRRDISLRIMPYAGRRPRTLFSARVLFRGLALLSIFAVMHYFRWLSQLRLDSDDIDGAIDLLQWGQKSRVDTTSLTGKVNLSEYTRNMTNSVRDGDQHDRGNHGHRESSQIVNKKGNLPSAKFLLKAKPPFEDSEIIQLYPSDSGTKPLVKSPNTVVTSYFRVSSKYHAEKYDGWMRNMLSLQDAMVIFTEPDLVNQISDLRSHAVNRTIIVPIRLDDLPIGRLFPNNFWQSQLDRDPEKRIHRSYQLFWIWLSKSWCLAQAIRMNVYDSDIFVWSDIGCFRQRTYNSKTLVVHRETVPRHEILQMAHHQPNPPNEDLFNDKYRHKSNFYHSGSQFVGYKDTMMTFHEYFLETID